MGRNNYNPRSNLRSERTIQPTLAARHLIEDSDEIAFFFSDARTALEQVLPPEDIETSKGRFRKKELFRLYDDPDSAGLSIFEQRLAQKHGEKQRIRWTKSDVGRIRGDIQNDLAQLELTGFPLSVTFTGIARLGNADARKARKLALVPDQASTVAEFFCNEHETAVNGLSGSMKRFRYPYAGDWIPHWTVANIFKEVHYEKKNQAVRALANLLPLTVEVTPLKFISEQDITHNITRNGLVWDSRADGDITPGI